MPFAGVQHHFTGCVINGLVDVVSGVLAARVLGLEGREPAPTIASGEAHRDR